MISAMLQRPEFSAPFRSRVAQDGADLVRRIRAQGKPGLMEAFLAEYGLSTREGIALMCLAEALLRVPDAPTIDALIEDKIAPSDWSAHLGQASSTLVNASTCGLMLTGAVLRDGAGLAGLLRGMVRRLGEPVIRTAVARAMREMGAQFVLGESIGEAMTRGAGQERAGYTYSYDMLGEAAMTAADAAAYKRAYEAALAGIAPAVWGRDMRDAPGLSVKLSALCPRYETRQRDRAMAELVPAVRDLARQARAAGMGLTIDAEESERLELSLDVIAAVLADPVLAGWDGFGVVVQAYGKRARAVIDWLHGLAEALDRRITVRLVKGAYWDAEIKRAQVEGIEGFPVYTRKSATDIAYLDCAVALLARTDRIYPQFATHNAHTVAAILALGADRDAYEFQKLHGMGDVLHDLVLAEHGTRCRIYAPVGPHRDLLAYLVRRLLENGANSSFVNRVVDATVPPEDVAGDPFEIWARAPGPNPAVTLPKALFGPARVNSAGWDVQDGATLERLTQARARFAETTWEAAPLLACAPAERAPRPQYDPSRPARIVGHVRWTDPGDVPRAAAAARPWGTSAEVRARVLEDAADSYEAHTPELCALLAREAGKTLDDSIAEIREAVDFLRYYAQAARDGVQAPARGTFACIAPWNFPLAIFTGQMAAALAAGNAVLSKPSELAPLVGARATALLHGAGVPRTALQVLPGDGVIGAALSALPGLEGMAFTGSTATAQRIARAMAADAAPGAPLIAETGGLNAMLVDSTALPEQAVRDIVTSAFRSNGQRCSALRILYVQQDCADRLLTMLKGHMDTLRIGAPWDPATDIGPAISADAAAQINAYVAAAEVEGRLLHRLPVPEHGHFTAPALLRVQGIAEMEREVFGPVLHVATFKPGEVDAVIDAVNGSGYGLTFGVQTRIDARVEHVARRVRAGNVYVNRNQVGAVVGSQPFGGEGLSGTGPKAGGPDYLARFQAQVPGEGISETDAAVADPRDVAAALAHAPWPEDPQGTQCHHMPGPTGEMNRLSTVPRGPVLCLGPGRDAARAQAAQARLAGCPAVTVCPGGDVDGALPLAALAELPHLSAVALWSGADQRAARIALAQRDGPLVPLLTEQSFATACRVERHLCADLTASGGNAALMIAADAAESG